MATVTTTDRVKKATVDAEGNVLTFNFADRAKTVRSVDLRDFPDEVRAEALSLGFRTKLQNSYNFSKESGLGPEDAVAAFDDAVDSLMAGEWNQGRAGGPSSATIAEALSRVLPAKYATADDALPVVRGWTDEEKVSKLKVPALAAMLIRLKAEKALARADSMTAEVGDL